MDEKYYKRLMQQTNKNRIAAGMRPFTWEEYRCKIQVILKRESAFIENYNEEDK